jgi:hypothetical protein
MPFDLFAVLSPRYTATVALSFGDDSTLKETGEWLFCRFTEITFLLSMATDDVASVY